MQLLKKYVGKRATAAMFSILHSHFAGGRSFADLKPTLDRLGSAGIGAILDYAAEGARTWHKRIVWCARLKPAVTRLQHFVET